MNAHAPGGAGGTAPASQPAPGHAAPDHAIDHVVSDHDVVPGDVVRERVGLVHAVSDEFVPEKERR